MKNNTILFFLLFLIGNAIAQTPDAKRDYHWLFGYESVSHKKDTLFGNTEVDFNKNPVKAKFKNIPMNFDDDIAIISDTTGKLLFYTNGIYVADSTHKPMKNGEGLNPGQFAIDNKDYGYICNQGSLILPKPNSTNLFYLMHSSIFINVNGEIGGEKLYYTLIDMSKNNGKGEVVEKNKVLINELVDFGKITACRHANGIDWWILMAGTDTKDIYTFLLSSEGIKFKHQDNFSKGNKGGIGQSVFSPDGTKYARFNGYDLLEHNQLLLYNFDRCTGRLSNQREFLAGDSTFCGGVAFSSNSRFLYAFDVTIAYQFDMQVSNTELKADTVAIYDSFLPPEFPLPTKFFLPQLAPDNKIYISMTNGHKYLHVINEPNKKGKACNLVQRGFKLATYNYTTMPNFPNFRLGKAAQPCTVGVEDEVENVEVKIYPNPVYDILSIEVTESLDNQTVTILDMLGKTVLSQQLSFGKNNINMGDVPSGTYILKVGNATRKVVKM